MKSLALKQAPDMVRPTRNASPAAVLAQRRSTLGSGGSITAPPIHDAGRPLDTATRSAMETGFGREFSNIRVHDDARAHDNARDLGARAYAAGDHIVFGEGRYRPETPSGRALIAHELAHSMQQGGVQMKADGPLPASADAELERQADRAALDVTAGRRASGLSSVNYPAVFRAEGDTSAASTAKTQEVAGSPPDLVGDLSLKEHSPIAATETPPGAGATFVDIAFAVFKFKAKKGSGKWVTDAYANAVASKSLIASRTRKGAKFSTIVEEPAAKYRSIWLNKYGFTKLEDLGNAITKAADTDPGVKGKIAPEPVGTIVNGFKAGNQGGCDIDHIVEKQLSGVSTPENLQLLGQTKNRTSGSTIKGQLDELSNKILALRTHVTDLQLRFESVDDLGDASSDPSFVIESLLRDKSSNITGSEDVKASAYGTPVTLLAGGKQAVTRLRPTGLTPIEANAQGLISGLKLLSYKRQSPISGKGKSGSKAVSADTDTVEGEISSKPLPPSKSKVYLTAGPGIAPDAATQPGGEYRELKLDKARSSHVEADYPNLSPLKFKSLDVDALGNSFGTAVIESSVKFLGPLDVNFGPDKLKLIKNIDTAAINSSAVMEPLKSVFRFTSADVTIDLINFKPEGNLNFTLGPQAKPVILGNLKATAEGGAFVAKGTLTPAEKIPGISKAEGNVTYRSDTGWSGLLTATASSIPNSTGTVNLGFKEEKGAFRAYGEGSFSTKVKDPDDLKLKVGWHGGAVSYWGAVTIANPMPLVKSVRLDGSYADDLLTLNGDANIEWRSIQSSMHVTYRRKDGEDGKFSGRADVKFPTNPDAKSKASGHIKLDFNEAGNYSGEGEVTYQINKDIQPKLGLKLVKGKLKASGGVTLGDIALSKKWPSPEGGKLTIIKGLSSTFDIPTPIPLVTIFGRLSASAGLGYSVGPVMLTGAKFDGELYPLEDDPQIIAHLTGKLSVPARANIYGTFGATIGARVAAGLVSAEGGVEVTPSLGITGEAALKVDAEYKAGAFSFEAEAFAQGKMDASLGVSLVATISGAWGLFAYSWNYPAWNLKKQIGPELKLTIGKVAYKNGDFTWPSLSQVKIQPEHIDPVEIIKDLVSSRTAAKK
jgi:hypothetical protein